MTTKQEYGKSVYRHLLNRTRITLSTQLLAAMEAKREEWKRVMIEGTYATAMKRSSDFSEYKQTIKREWVTEKQDLTSLLGNIQTKLKPYNLRPYEPPPGLGLEVVLTRLRHPFIF